MTWDYENWPSVMLAVAIFVLIKQLCKWKLFQTPQFAKLVRWLSGASFGIYLIHIFVINQLTARLSINTASGWWRLIGAPAVYIIALLAVKLLQKIPYVGKRLFP